MRHIHVVVIGAGINGLVAANYLRRAGAEVTLLERRSVVGGACVGEHGRARGIDFEYPLGATVLGMMQDFVLKETGLVERLELFAPRHPKMVSFPKEAPVRIFRDGRRLQQELAERWGERGDVRAFRSDEDRVVRYLRHGFRKARTPSSDEARAVLGDRMTGLWITGTARDLLDHYFTDDRTKIYMGSTVIESGPTSYDEPCSAFNVPLMDSGSVFGGYWGFVKGGIWRVTEELGEIDRALGVRLETGIHVLKVDRKEGDVAFVGSDGRPRAFSADAIVFATDPRTAARICGDGHAYARTSSMEFAGTSGKAMLVFRNPVRWKNSTGRHGFPSAFKFFYEHGSLDALERSSQQVKDGTTEYAPGYFQMYCEGAAMRRMGLRRRYDTLAVFFKSMGWRKNAAEMDHVRDEVVARVLREVRNPPSDIVWSGLLTPADLRERFFFPLGNIDHALLGDGQNFDGRTCSSDPERAFYRLGDAKNIWYCGAGAYPCGSVAGTPGYMCATQLMRSLL